jgi:hypothetical protein
MRRTAALLTALLLAAFMAAPAAHAAATIVIQNNNAAGVGFNDPAPRAPVGGNTGTTLGEQRLIAFQHAASIWGATLDSNATIIILASFEPLSCNATSAVLGSAGALNVFANFTNRPIANTWYPVALASKLAGARLQTTPDIRARFNVNLGNTGCLTGIGWYLGLDNNHGTQVDLVAVLLHEFGHGLGFQQFSSLTTGAFLGSPTQPLPDVYLRNLYDKSSGKYWNQMSNSERVASALNARRVVWDGPQVTSRTSDVLTTGVPILHISAPASIGGYYPVGTAQFGEPLTPAGVTGNLVLAVDPNDAAGPSTTDACSPLTNAAAIAGNIAVVDRGSCNFTVKVKNAQDAGATGVVVADNAAGAPPAALGGADPEVFIPAVRVTLPDGNAIKAQLAAGVSATMLFDTALHRGADEQERAQMNAPNPLVAGSSISHWDPTATPNQLMEPNINGDLTHSLSGVDMTLDLMRDIGWYADGDLDMVADDVDNCPAAANTDQANNDGDGQGDACDADDDNDGVDDAGDNCPMTSNSGQENNDGDGAGDVCDPDDDNDAVDDGVDNCPFTANTDQADNDADSQGDACDLDDDNDGVADEADACPMTAPSMGLDADGNGCTDTIAGLKEIVGGLPVPPKVQNGMMGKLNEAEKAAARGANYTAVNKLFDFIDQVEGVRGSYLDDATADLLVEYARNLIRLLGGPRQPRDGGGTN